jgi:hypothetical protein
MGTESILTTNLNSAFKLVVEIDSVPAREPNR